MTKINKVQYLLFLILIVFLASCAGINAKPYSQKVKPILEPYSIENFKASFHEATNLVNNAREDNKEDFYLSLIERAKIALAKGDYEKAIKDFQMAERRFLRIEGTISINEEIGSFFSNELNKEYEPDPHELILISPYLALAYLLKGDFNGARIERNRTINKINQYIRNSGKTYLENPFARYIAALIYEMENKYQDAYIEYKNIAKIPYLKHIKDTHNTKKNKGKNTEIVILIDAGLSPYKYEAIFGPLYIRIKNINTVVRFAYPKIQKTKSIIDNFKILVDNKIVETKLIYDLENSIMKSFKDTSARREKHIFSRVVAKLAISIGGQVAGEAVGGDAGAAIKALSSIFNVASAYMEQADLRQWKTLPKNIQYSRIQNITPGRHNILIKYNGGQKIIKDFEVKKNEINLLYTVIPR